MSLEPSEILPWLYLGHMNSAKDFPTLERHNITTIVNTCLETCDPGSDFYGPERSYVPVDIAEKPAGNALVQIPMVFEAIDAAKTSGSAALVHCVASISRSPVFVIAYVMREKGLSAVEATKFVAERWDATWPNDSFVGQLLVYENELEKQGKR
ncbi:hypothetical protein CYMTET_28577 [Cymbomonas tetramitiformis]|uniref:protein-tyrosine-phosphatase n=1 Tax=Cymbomonas tetramitiformis TaxID=36881 RepID=A0AAE0BN21_9CHLO|nr:hypothetical protein CYMTET_50436 [Cymbomonas tetramitiformis]KAK3262574.1 hypothetical protein CYMTET_28577 [Cymbomonas tetramitiformis]|eukprot:gene26252-32173_t